MTPIELLAPAKNIEYGKAAIIHGADAVYIGASRYSARANASNNVNDIGELVRFAHLYNAKVYAALNTILYDHEIEDAARLIHQLYETGIDAVIIQDMGLLQCDLPPIPLFASTQTHNTSLSKITLFEQLGFQRVILARELSLAEIENIRQHSSIELESFVHGALCVSYSGQCYMSHAISGRSGNRGVCAQPCRMKYTLSDASGKTLINDAYLLSLKDLNLSARLYDLLKAGITSFKIEGRLKDLTYLKNITAYYRHCLDAILEHNNQWYKSSSGKTTLHFGPDLYKSFNRGYTEYFIDERKNKVGSPETQKSIGEKLGKTVTITPQWFSIDTHETISNGDGLCWFHPKNGLEGLLVNRVEGERIFPAKPVKLQPGITMYRNNDFRFEKTLSGQSADRRIEVSLCLTEHPQGYLLNARDEDGNTAEHITSTEKMIAKDPEKAREQIINQLSKLGNTIFTSNKINIPQSFPYFIPASILNEMRRETINLLEKKRLQAYPRSQRPESSIENEEIDLFGKELDHHSNVANRYAKEFYLKHGATQVEDAFELQKDFHGKVLMTTKHCIKYQFNACPAKQRPDKPWQEPLSLCSGKQTYHLEFDCMNCLMKIRMPEKLHL